MKILLPRGRDEAVIVNTSGGLTGGDVLTFSANVQGNDYLTLTTQAAERVYRSAEGQASLRQDLTVGADARLDWLPQETILYQSSGLKRRLNVNLTGSAQFLGLETYLLGRLAHGEILEKTDLSDQWRITRDGALIHAEALSLKAVPRSPATGANIHAMATLIYAAPMARDLLDQIRELSAVPQTKFGATAPREDILVVRMIAADGQSLRNLIYPLLTVFRPQAPPRVWQI